MARTVSGPVAHSATISARASRARSALTLARPAGSSSVMRTRTVDMRVDSSRRTGKCEGWRDERGPSVDQCGSAGDEPTTGTGNERRPNSAVIPSGAAQRRRRGIAVVPVKGRPSAEPKNDADYADYAV